MTFEEFFKQKYGNFLGMASDGLVHFTVEIFHDEIMEAFQAGQENPNVKWDYIPTNADYHPIYHSEDNDR